MATGFVFSGSPTDRLTSKMHSSLISADYYIQIVPTVFFMVFIVILLNIDRKRYMIISRADGSLS